MNVSGKLRPGYYEEHWIPIKKAKPTESGVYTINIIQIGIITSKYLFGKFYFDNGDSIPDSIIIEWK